MSKTLRMAAFAAVLATVATSVPSITYAREGTARSIGHGVKCRTVNGQRVCTRGV